MASNIARSPGRMLLCASMFAALAAVAPMGVAGAEPPPAGTRVVGFLDIPCVTTTLRQDSDWYLPAGPARGMVVLVHGFGATKDQYRELASALSADGELVLVPTLPAVDVRGCAVSSLIGNKAFLDNLADVIAGAGDPAGALRTSLRAATEQAGRTDIDVPDRLVLMGHSAGGDATFRIATRLAVTPGSSGLAGLVQLDPVRGIDPSVTDDALAALAPTGLPILAVSTPPSLCNNGASGTQSMRQYLPGRFLGVRVSGGSHADALGTGDALISGAAGLLCGTVTENHAAVTRDFAVAWTRDELTGSQSDGFYPGTAGFDQSVASGAISVTEP
ncbi:alpha/beta hydrolase [Nocardia sp. NPDC059764]|uniref:alpha/beta hydrolase n=1 Tax=Nocardia sp. NPDC059764 TaxID=3346939 RepID=UPI0036544922